MHVFAPKGLGLIAKNSPLALVDENVFKLREFIEKNPKIKVETDIILVFNKTGLIATDIDNNNTPIIDNGVYTVIVVKYGDIFNYDNKSYYVRSNEVFVSKNLNEVLEFKETKNRKVKKLEKEEQDALAWLDSGEKGVSSLSMCYVLFPNLRKHASFTGTVIKYPSDIEAITRCMKFFEAVPDSLSRVGELREINKQWNYIVDNLDVLKQAIQDKNTKLIIETLKNIDKI